MVGREEAIAELQRRGVDISKYQQQPQIQQQNIRQTQNGANDPSLADLPDFSGETEAAISGGARSFGKLFGNKGLQQYLDPGYQKSMQEHPNYTTGGEYAADIAKDAPLFAATGGAGYLGKSPILRGALSNAITKLLERPEEDESRLGNAAEGGVGVLAGGGLIKGATKIPGFAKTIAKSFNKETIGTEIGKTVKGLKKEFNGLYENLLDSATSKGIKADLQNGKFINKFHRLREGLPKSAVKTVSKAIANNDSRGLHKAQSNVGKYINKQLSSQRKGGTIDLDALENATNLQKLLKSELNTTLKKGGLDKEYQAITKGYKERVIPYTKNPAIQEYLAGELTERDLVKALQGGNKAGKSFRKHLSAKHPEVKINKLKNYALGGLALTGASGKAYNLFNKAQE